MTFQSLVDWKTCKFPAAPMTNKYLCRELVQNSYYMVKLHCQLLLYSTGLPKSNLRTKCSIVLQIYSYRYLYVVYGLEEKDIVSQNFYEKCLNCWQYDWDNVDLVHITGLEDVSHANLTMVICKKVNRLINFSYYVDL